jgi:hypothetical protein
MRWGLGGLVLAFVWSLISSAAQGSFANPAGGLVAGIVRILVGVVLPVGFLGFLWGWSERRRLERVSANGVSQLNVSIRRIVSRQTLKAMMCGIVFGIFFHGLRQFPGFRSFDSTGNLRDDSYMVLSFMLLAIPVGIVVGVLFKRNLLRRLS